MRAEAPIPHTNQVPEAALEAGAEDVVEGDQTVDAITGASEFTDVRDVLGKDFALAHAEISMEPSTTVALSGSEAARMIRLADSLEDLDDVQNFYANFDISDEVMAEFA